MRSPNSPAYQLVGQELPKGWRVTERAIVPAGFSEGQNSVGYFVRSQNDEEAFLKAFDYYDALLRTNADDLYEISRSYRYERDLLLLCNSVGLNHVVRIIEHDGILLVEGDPASLVQYLIFERAQDDIRSFAGHRDNRISWTLNMIHQITVATQQLHSIGVAHQDIKPGNTLIFNNEIAKLGDLGRSTQHGNPAPYDHLVIAGDPDYAPPELLYCKGDELPRGWDTRRLGCDFYMLGSVIHYMCAGVSMTHRLHEKLAPQLWPIYWTGTYNEVFPFVQNSFSQCIDELEETTHDAVASDIANLVKQLCNPRPEERGLPLNQGFNQFSMRKFVSNFNLIYKRNQLAAWRNAPISQKVES